MRNTSATLEVRTMGAVLLRRIYTSTTFEEFWPKFPPDAQVCPIVNNDIFCVVNGLSEIKLIRYFNF